MKKSEKTAKVNSIPAEAKPAERIIAYKGFNHGLVCRGFRYEVGKSYEMPPDEVSVCKTVDEAEAKFKVRAKVCHPDQGGDPHQMADLNLAIKDARAELAQ